MQTMRKPLWIFLTITLPQALLLAVMGKILSVIRPLLDPFQVRGWKTFGAVILLFAAASTSYAVFCYLRKKEIVPWFGAVVFSVCVPLVYASLTLREQLIPVSVPGWMMFDLEPVVVLESLIVPALAYSMLLSVFWLTPRKGETKMVNDVILAGTIPFCWYLFFVVIVPGLNGSNEIFEHALLILFVFSSIAFLFFLTRVFFIFLSRKPDFWKKLILPVVLIFPLLGLAINLSTYGPFGNFSHPGFFITAAICGVLLIMPEWEGPRKRLLVFLGKMLLFPYVLYFFVVFLPYVPLAIPAIIAVGTGFLILTPTLLFLIHIRSLHIDLCYLRQYFNPKIVMITGVLLTLVLPLVITAFYCQDRMNLEKAMASVVNPSYQNAEPVEVKRKGIRRTLTNIQQNTGRDDFILPVFSQQTPLLSAWYRFIVTDNLTLSSDKVELIRQVILGEDIPEAQEGRNISSVELEEIMVDTVYDAGEKAWRSWVHLTLQNSAGPLAEYQTQFKLPEGCYISNYYLVVNGEKKFGLLADKRAAEWIYRQITTVKRDPGLLRYVGSNMLELRVFPFSVNETRLTGFEILHKESAVFSIDNETVDLAAEKIEAPITLEGAVYLPTSAKTALETVTRENEWFFLVDYTDTEKSPEYLQRAESFIRRQNLDNAQAHILYVNDNLWDIQAQQRRFNAPGGGFYADKAIKTILYANYSQKSPKRPVFVLVTDELKNAVMRDDFDLWQAALPEGDAVYHLEGSEELYAFKMARFQNQAGKRVNTVEPVPVHAWPDAQNPQAYLSDQPGAAIIFDPAAEKALNAVNTAGRGNALKESDSENAPKTAAFRSGWEMAVLQEAAYFNAILHPEKKMESQFRLVQGSISSGILSPYTAYIVLENEAQENMLREKQKQILAAKSDVDLGENLAEETVMSEPGLLVMAALLLGAMLLRKRKAAGEPTASSDPDNAAAQMVE